MISVIISSYKESYFKQIQLSIKQTIGLPYEIIKVDNPGLYSLTEAYNMGAAKAIFDIFCFVHEDVIFHTVNWGQNIVEHFTKDLDLGLIGIAGSTEKLPLPTGWGSHDKSRNRINILQRNDLGNSYEISTFKGDNVEFLKVIDGVFMATKKNIWRSINFDEQIKGYHLYDIDFSLRVSQKYKIAIVYDILIEHLSHGNYDDNWLKALINYHDNESKVYLFSEINKQTKLVRWPHYLLLVKADISYKYRVLYLKKLGIDLYSLPVIYMFLFPGVGKQIIGMYKGFKNFGRRVHKIYNR